MSRYKHILFAVDFSGHSDNVANKAKELADDNQAKLSIIHVLDNLPVLEASYEPIVPLYAGLTEQLMDTAKKRLLKIAHKLNIAENQQWLEIGSATLEIIRIAEEHEVDLIVIGSHGRHGLALLLGSTANAVLHHAKCDVLAVRLKND